MAVTIHDLYEILNQDKTLELKLLAGREGLFRPVKWVHIVETPELAAFLEGGEFVFLTGITLKDESELKYLIQNLSDNGASGILINLGPYIPQIPEEAAALCEALSIPLFTVPWNVYLGNVMRICAHEITSWERNSQEVEEAFRTAVFEHDRLDQYVPVFERHGFSVDWTYCTAVMEFSGSDNDTLIEKHITRAFNKISGAIHSYSSHSVQLRAGNQILLLFANKTDQEVSDIFSEIWKTCFALDGEGIPTYMGIGRNTKSIRCIYKSYNLAIRVMQLQKKRSESGKIMSYRSLGFMKLFLAMEDTDVMREYYNDVLGALGEYDRLNGTDYLPFLSIFFDHGASVKDTAEALYLHRNTVNYKLRKIEEILCCDLSDLYSRTELLIALRLTEIL